MTKFSLEFYRENWNQPLINHIKGMIRKNMGEPLEDLARTLEEISPVGNTYEECLDMITKINSLMEKEDGK